MLFRLFGALVAVVSCFFFGQIAVAQEQKLPSFETLFETLPFDTWIVNGNVYTVIHTPLDGVSRTVQQVLLRKNDINRGWFLNQYDKWNSNLVAQTSEGDITTFSYEFDNVDGAKQLRSISAQGFPISQDRYITPTPEAKSCDPHSAIPKCFHLFQYGMQFGNFLRIYPDNQLVGGYLTSTFLTDDGPHINIQRFNVEYPIPNVMRIVFEPKGDWSYRDAWQEWRLEDGKIVWEICSLMSLGADLCKGRYPYNE